MSCRLPIFKKISRMTNIITAVTINHFLMPRYMFFEIRKICDIMAPQWKKLQATWPLRSSWYILLVTRWIICREKSKMGDFLLR